jgi:hypothetical protein
MQHHIDQSMHQSINMLAGEEKTEPLDAILLGFQISMTTAFGIITFCST